MQTETGREAKRGGGVKGGDVASEPGWKERHDEKVAAIVERVRELAQLGARIHVDKGGEHHVVPLPGDPRFKTRPVDISRLNEILEIDVAQRRCVAEPGVSFAQLARATLAHGLLPKVVPELEGITIGGAVAGCSIEAMSYKYGGFHDNCLEYEVVSGTGEVVTCSREHEPDAFEMIHGSYGTLGILTRLTFELIEAKPYVQMEYRRYTSAEEFYEAMRSCCESGCADFVDGIVHGPDEHVLCLGNFVDKAPYVSSYRWLNIFYKSTRFRDVDYLSTFDYCFRYDTECHWLTRTVPPLEWKPVRLLVGKWLLGSTNLIRWSNRLERILGLKKRPDVVVDVFIPAPHYVEFFEWYDRDFDFYPLWIVPYKVPEVYPWISEALKERMPEGFFIDCAVYGRPNSEPDVDYSQLIEEKTFELAGIKTLISRNHYTPERFWDVYNRPNYEAAKARLDPDGAFPDLYEAFGRVE